MHQLSLTVGASDRGTVSGNQILTNLETVASHITNENWMGRYKKEMIENCTLMSYETWLILQCHYYL